jgi:hypothetical protein
MFVAQRRIKVAIEFFPHSGPVGTLNAGPDRVRKGLRVAACAGFRSFE